MLDKKHFLEVENCLCFWHKSLQAWKKEKAANRFVLSLSFTHTNARAANEHLTEDLRQEMNMDYFPPLRASFYLREKQILMLPKQIVH